MTEEVAQLLARGEELYRCEELIQAESVLSEAVARDPACAEAHFQLGLVLRSGLSDVPKILRARHEFAAALHARESWTQARLEFGRVSLWTSALETAMEAFRHVLREEPSNAEAWFLLYGCLLEEDAYEQASHALQRACELAPEVAEYSHERERMRSLSAKAHRTFSRFPLKVSAFADLPAAIESHVLPEMRNVPRFLSEESRVFTIGSCFARNIAIGLRALGVDAHHADQTEDIHNTYANRFFFEWLSGIPNAHTEVFERALGEAYRERIMGVLRNAEVIVYSLGVSCAFFDRKTQEPVLTIGLNQNMALQSEKAVFRAITVAENVDNLLRIAELIERACPRSMFVVTVSPVPLRASLEHDSAIVADCLSKSALRLAADEFVRKTTNRAFYWPSFEIVRWMGSYTEPIFGAEDDSAFHVNQAVVDQILRAFIRRFGSEGLAARC